MATLIGLCIRTKLLRSLPPRFKVDILAVSDPSTEAAVNKQLNDKERVAAALENAALLDMVNRCLGGSTVPRWCCKQINAPAPAVTHGTCSVAVTMCKRPASHSPAHDDGCMRLCEPPCNRWMQDPQVVRFFDRKGFYSVHGDSALFIARDFYRTLAVVKYLGGQPPASTPGGRAAATTTPGPAGNSSSSSGRTGLASVTLNQSLFESVLRVLLLEGGQHSVQLWEGAGATWSLARSEGQRVVGVAFLDAATRRLGACELPDDDHFCCLEALLMQLGVKEVVLPKLGTGKDGSTQADAGAAAAAAEGRRLRDALSRVGVMGSEAARASFATKHLEQDLARLLAQSGSVEQHRDVLERPCASAALAGLVAFASLTSDGSGLGKHSLALYDPGRFMRLDAAASRALNVLPQRLDGSASFSLYGIMARGKTAMGKRLLKAWLKAPLVDPAAIQQRLDIVEALVTDQGLREAVRDALRGMPDIERLARKLEAQRASLADLCQLYRASSVLPRLEEALRCHEGPAAELLVSRYAAPLAEHHDESHLTKFELLLEASLDLEAVPQEYLISAAYDSRLQSLRDDKDAVEAEIASLAAAAAKDLGLILDKTIKLEWHKAANTKTRCLRITQKEEKVVRSKLNARYMTLETRKDGTKFTSRALKGAAERQAELSGRYEGLQKDLVAQQVVGVAATFTGVWVEVAGLIAELDVLAGFADLATADPTRPYCKPEILDRDEGDIVIKGSRHPCVEVQEGVSFVSNDCVMERGASWFNIITGPNMGGKSTFIRQVGCLVLMAQVGCFVPADSARIAPRDAIFARVGAGDCQQRGVSTFMAEMLETGAILRGASSRSLIIIDELGRGTSTYDGFGLAWAIAEHIMQHIGAPALFATHFHELTDIRGPGGVANLHVQTQLEEATDLHGLTQLDEAKWGNGSGS
ncbi:DNA mismatch repair protein [Scenedesmus sp. NREL 46B-D3]|nr:DNA mismatch repair protein [Scenedesmus sp. NREL 46B-D3]